MEKKLSTFIAAILVFGIGFALSAFRSAGAMELKPIFSGKDKSRKQIRVRLEKVLEGLSEPTDIQFVPGRDNEMVVLEKTGGLKWFDLKTKKSKTLKTLSVLTSSEQGLLGVAFHPRYRKNGKFFLNYSTRSGGRKVSRVSAWNVSRPATIQSARISETRTVFEVVQPYSNHNAGSLAFGPDGMLYIGWGDGGSGGDPLRHGQNPKSFLGSMMRIDIDSPSNNHGYKIPSDNPKIGYLPEIWAIGFRNPWKYSFDPGGRLIVADVGQNSWEEIDIVTKGGNYGWNIREASYCYEPSTGCRAEGLLDPVYEYDHNEGNSITGGYVYEGKIAALRGKYIFGDFVSGRIWAVELPRNVSGKVATAYALGKFSLLISTFGKDAAGEVYVGGYSKGTVYRIIWDSQRE